MYLFVFVGLAWLLTAPAMAVLSGKLASVGARRARAGSALTTLQSEFRHTTRVPAAGGR